MLNFYSDDPAIVRENCDVLLSEIEDTIIDTSNLFSMNPKSDILSVLQDKIDYYKVSSGENSDETPLTDLRSEINQTLSHNIFNEFHYLRDLLETTGVVDSFGLEYCLSTMFKFFYIKRKELLVEYILDQVITKRNSFCKRYKQIDSKKDLTYKTIRSEVKVRNPEYYIILMHSNEICTDIATDDSINFLDMLNHLIPSESEYEFFHELLQGDMGVRVQATICDSFMKSEYVSSFKAEFKQILLKNIKQIN